MEKVKYEFDDNFRYELNYRVEGIISKTVREFDIAIFRENEKFPFWIIECKNWDEKYIKEIEQMPTKSKNLCKTPEKITFIITHEPSGGAKNTAKSEGIDIEIISEKEAFQRSWFHEASKIWPYDTMFHPKVYQAKKAIERGDYVIAIEKLENVGYDEWLKVVDYSFNKYQKIIEKFLKIIAEFHHDDGWRYNAIKKLDDFGLLNKIFRDRILTKECDQETKEILLNL